jgi:hypothetical protein
MFYFILFRILLLSFAHNFKNCFDTVSSIKSLILDPDPPLFNNGNNIIIYGSIKDKIVNSGNIYVQIYYLNSWIYNITYDLCSLTKCPINNDYVILYNVNIPSFAPIGNYNIKLNITNIDCISLDVYVTDKMNNY